MEFIGQPQKYKNAELLVKKFTKLRTQLQTLKTSYQIYEEVPLIQGVDFKIKTMFGKHMRKHSIKKGEAKLSPRGSPRRGSKGKKERFDDLVNAEIFRNE